MSDQKLTSEVEVKGADKAAKDIGKVVSTQKQLAESTDELAKATGLLAGSTGDLAESSKKLRRQRTVNRVEAITRKVATLASVVVKVAVALRLVRNSMRRFPAMLALEVGIIRTIRVLREEVAQRLRLIEVMRVQGKVTDELRAKSRQQQETLERVAGGRRMGGFDADTARRVRGEATAAGEQFKQLQPGDINQAFGLFGDIQGLSRQDRTDLAIIASFGELGVDPRRVREQESGRRIADLYLKRFRESGRIETFRRRESVQGQGVGQGEFRPQVTERAAAVVAEGRTVGGAKALFRERLKRALRPEADVDLAVELYEMYGTAGEMKGAQVGYASLRPLTTLMKRLLTEPQVDVMLKDQPGYVRGLLEKIGFPKIKTMPLQEWEDIVGAIEEIERAGIPRGGQGVPPVVNTRNRIPDAADITATSREPRVTINNYQGSRFVGPSARAQQSEILNGRTRAERMELVR